jgi:glycine betaine/choline ABC-type transport system substrate-binding protein
LSAVRRLLCLVITTILASACSGTGPGAIPTPTPTPTPTRTIDPLRVGTSPEQEARLLALTLVAMLEGARLPAMVETFDGATDARQALELGAIDLLPGYTGAAWLDVLGRPDPPGDPRTSYRRVRQDDADGGVVWLRPRFALEEGLDVPPANATFAFFVQGPPSLAASLATMSQLAARLGEQPEALLCVDPEFAERADGLEAVLDAYAIADVRSAPAPPDEAIAGVGSGECLAGLATATDGAAWRAGLRPLIDDLRVFPAFVVTVQVPNGLRVSRPDVVAAITPFTDHLTTERLGRWNAQVVGGADVEQVAAEAARQLAELAGAAGPQTPEGG